MALSKECDQVSSSTSGDPADTSDLATFQWKYLQISTDRVQSLFVKQAALEKQQAANMSELQKALVAQTEAECFWRSSLLGDFPVLTDADISSVLGLGLSALGDLVLGPQPPATTQSAPAPAVRKPKLPKLTILSPRLANGFGSTTTTRNKPTKPAKGFSARPICRKPSKRAAPPAAEDDLPTSSSA